tara:strand:+ start:126 stop:479 length:354 start_codon:yes stop_codon:yes gene_type:complete
VEVQRYVQVLVLLLVLLLLLENTWPAIRVVRLVLRVHTRIQLETLAVRTVVLGSIVPAVPPAVRIVQAGNTTTRTVASTATAVQLESIVALVPPAVAVVHRVDTVVPDTGLVMPVVN